jgi:hypothetical protein
MARETVSKYISLRRNHPAWSLLASPKGPLILASLNSLIDSSPGGVVLEEAVERLATVFADYANDSEFDLGEDHPLAARREIRQWIKRGLIVERDGKILATDAFQRALLFRLEQEYLPTELVHRQLHAWVQGADRFAQRFL